MSCSRPARRSRPACTTPLPSCWPARSAISRSRPAHGRGLMTWPAPLTCGSVPRWPSAPFPGPTRRGTVRGDTAGLADGGLDECRGRGGTAGGEPDRPQRAPRRRLGERVQHVGAGPGVGARDDLPGGPVPVLGQGLVGAEIAGEADRPDVRTADLADAAEEVLDAVGRDGGAGDHGPGGAVPVL